MTTITNTSPIQCQCTCGQTTLELASKPLTRFYCHCTICQNLYKKPHSDVTVVWTKDLKFTNDSNIKYVRPGLLLKRGVCQLCDQPVAGLLTMIPGLKLAFVPAGIYSDQSALPESEAHIFYHRNRIKNTDNIHKQKGFIRSELRISWIVLKAIIRNLFKKA